MVHTQIKPIKFYSEPNSFLQLYFQWNTVCAAWQTVDKDVDDTGESLLVCGSMTSQFE
jgi:hypothetical protein